MQFRPKAKSGQTKAVREAASAAADGEMYNFNLWVSRLKMQKYMAICKFKGTSVAKELNRIIDREIKKSDMFS